MYKKTLLSLWVIFSCILPVEAVSDLELLSRDFRDLAQMDHRDPEVS